MRRWAPGEHEVNGLRFRIVRGEKLTKLGEKGLDLRLDVFTGQGWQPVHMYLGGFLADFFTENEDVLYPRYTPEGLRTPWRGGEKYLAYLRDAWKYGWHKAEAELQRERAQKSLFEKEEAS